MTDESGLERWVHKNITIGTGQTIAYGAAMLALGVWFGNQITGRIATRAWPTNGVLVSGEPAWIGTVETVNWAALAIFCIGIVVVITIDALDQLKQ